MKRSKKDLLKNILWRVEDIDRSILVDDPDEGEIYNDLGGISLENNRELRAINEKLDALIDILTKTREPLGAEFGIPSEQIKPRMLVREVYEMDNENVPGDPMEDNR